MNHALTRHAPIVVMSAHRLAPRHVWSGEDQAIPLYGGPCTPEDCGHTCWWEARGQRLGDWGRPVTGPRGWYHRDITVHHADAGDVDGEGPCTCEHHEEEAA